MASSSDTFLDSVAALHNAIKNTDLTYSERVEIFTNELAKYDDTRRRELINTSYNGIFLLSLAVERRQDRLIGLLLKEGSDPLSQDEHGQSTALHVAIGSKLNKAFDAIIKFVGDSSNCSPDTVDRLLATENRNGEIPIFLAASSDNAHAFLQLLRLHKTPLSQIKNKEGLTLLEVAKKSQSTEIINLINRFSEGEQLGELIQAHQDGLTSERKDESKAHEQTVQEHKEVSPDPANRIRELFENPSLEDSLAAANIDHELLRCSPDERKKIINNNRDGFNPLIEAIKKDRLDLVMVLLNRGGDLSHAVIGEEKLTPDERRIAIAAVIDKAPDRIKRVLLIDALQREQHDLVQLLKEIGTDLLLAAIENDYLSDAGAANIIARELAHYPGTEREELINRERNGSYLLFKAMGNNLVNVVKVLLENGVNLSVKQDGRNILHVAMTCEIEVVELLVDFMKDKSKCPPQMVKAILNEEFETRIPIFYALALGKLDQIIKLQELYQEPILNIKNRDGLNMLELARWYDLDFHEDKTSVDIRYVHFYKKIIIYLEQLQNKFIYYSDEVKQAPEEKVPLSGKQLLARILMFQQGLVKIIESQSSEIGNSYFRDACKLLNENIIIPFLQKYKDDCDNPKILLFYQSLIKEFAAKLSILSHPEWYFESTGKLCGAQYTPYVLMRDIANVGELLGLLKSPIGEEVLGELSMLLPPMLVRPSTESKQSQLSHIDRKLMSYFGSKLKSGIEASEFVLAVRFALTRVDRVGFMRLGKSDLLLHEDYRMPMVVLLDELVSSCEKRHTPARILTESAELKTYDTFKAKLEPCIHQLEDLRDLFSIFLKDKIGENPSRNDQAADDLGELVKHINDAILRLRNFLDVKQIPDLPILARRYQTVEYEFFYSQQGLEIFTKALNAAKAIRSAHPSFFSNPRTQNMKQAAESVVENLNSTMAGIVLECAGAGRSFSPSDQ